MKKIFTLAITTGFLLIQIHASAQKKILKKLFSNEKDTTRSSSFIPLPALGYAQETGLEFGLVTLYSFYTDRKDTLTRNSSYSGLATFTTKKQSNLKLNADIWSPKNIWHNHSELRLKNFPFNFYGIGNTTNVADKDVVVQKLFRITHETEKKLGKDSYIGLTASFEHYNYEDEKSGGIFGSNSTGGNALLVGASYIIDNRNTNTYTTKGIYTKVNYAISPGIKSWFKGSTQKVDTRFFISPSKKTVFGLQTVLQRTEGDNIPFYLLPQLGNDQLMRGYYTGRYRDDELFAAQAEFRYRFLPRLGIVGFAGFGNVADKNGSMFKGMKPSYGAGGRYFFDVDRGLSIRVDYALGEKRQGEPRQSGFYISLGEAF